MTTSFTTHFRFGLPDFLSGPWHEDWYQLVHMLDRVLYEAFIASGGTVWTNDTNYTVGSIVISPQDGSFWTVATDHTSATSPTTFSDDRTANPTFWNAFPGLPTNVALLDVEDQQTSGGSRVTSKSLGTVSTGTLTLDPGDRPLQHYLNNGAHTLAPGVNSGAFLLDIVNGAGAGAITVSGWTKVAGDPFTTTNGDKFRCHVSIGNNGSLLSVQAMQ